MRRFWSFLDAQPRLVVVVALSTLAACTSEPALSSGGAWETGGESSGSSVTTGGMETGDGEGTTSGVSSDGVDPGTESSSGVEETGSTSGGEQTGDGPPPETLRELADLVGMRVGTATKPFELASDPAYASVIADEFNLITPEYSAKWRSLQPSQGEWFFDEFDALVDHAEKHGQAIKGHTLVWYYEVPDWAAALGPAEFESAVNAHIDETMTRYADRIWAWDVVNEAIADGLTGTEPPVDRLRDSVFLERLGPDFIADAFIRARAADPDALLLYNDYGIIGPGPKSDAVYDLLAGLLADGVPVDAVGFQTHLQLERFPAPEVIRANLERFAALGLEVHISEMDVSTSSLGGDASERLEAQRLAYQSVVEVCATLRACTTVSFWGVSDDYSWLNSPEVPDIPLLFDDAKAKKPAYDGVWAGLQGEATFEGANVVQHGDFEGGELGWTQTGGSLQVLDGVGTDGSRGARVTDRSEVWMGPGQELAGDFQPMSMWVARAQVRVGSGQHRVAQVLRLGPVSNAQYRGVQETVAPNGFVALSGVFTVGADGLPPEVFMYFEGPAPGVDLYVDDVVIAPLQGMRASAGVSMIGGGR